MNISSTPVPRRGTAQPMSFKAGEEAPVLKLDRFGNYKIHKGIKLPKRGIGMKYAVSKMLVGDSLKADTQAEAIRIYTSMYNLGYKARQYKTGHGFWWVQRVK